MAEWSDIPGRPALIKNDLYNWDFYLDPSQIYINPLPQKRGMGDQMAKILAEMYMKSQAHQGYQMPYIDPDYERRALLDERKSGMVDFLMNKYSQWPRRWDGTI